MEQRRLILRMGKNSFLGQRDHILVMPESYSSSWAFGMRMKILTFIDRILESPLIEGSWMKRHGWP